MKAYLPALIWLLTILVISGYPGDYVPEVPVWQFDKLVHTSIYLILSILMLIAFHKQYSNSSVRYKLSILVALFGIFYGGFMEFLQDYIFINRSGNWYDFTANAFGAILGIMLFPLINKKIPFKRWLKIK